VQAGFLPVGPGPSAPGPLTPPKGQPKSGGTLREGNLGDLPNLDGHFINGQHTTYPIWDRLVDLDSSLNPHPSLAESWDVDKDFTTATFHLKKGVMFHTGREMTADDVVWNYQRLKSDRTVDGGVKANFLVPMTGIEAPDKYTVVMHAEQKWPSIFSVLAWCNILDPQTFQSDGPNKPVGTGPFSFVEWVQGDHITLKKNPSYWQSGKPYLDGINIQIFADPQSMTTQLEAGAIDVAILPVIRDAARLAKDAKYQVIYNQTSGSVNALLTQNKADAGPTTNKMFRQALSYAMDRQRWVDTVLPGVGSAKNLPVPPSSPAFDAAKDKLYTFDLDKAKSLLQQSGVGTPSIEVVYSSVNADYARVLQIFQADLAKIGITLNLKAQEQVAYNDQMFGSKWANLLAGGSLFGQLHPAFFWGNAAYSPDHNWPQFKTDEYTKIGETILREADPVKAKQGYSQWTDYILDQAWVLVWANTVPRTATSANVQGMQYNMTEFLMPNNAWLGA
jgi:peptide/nickel transport system substrate-binding protein